MKRKLAEHDNLKITIEQNGDKFHIKESSTFRTKENDFTLGVPFEYTLADGTEVSVGGRSYRWLKVQYFAEFLLPRISNNNVCIYPANELPRTEVYIWKGIKTRWLPGGLGGWMQHLIGVSLSWIEVSVRFWCLL